MDITYLSRAFILFFTLFLRAQGVLAFPKYFFISLENSLLNIIISFSQNTLSSLSDHFGSTDKTK